MLEFLSVTKGYGSELLLDDVSFRVGDSDKAGLVGANGSGKTTIFRLIVGDEVPEGGTIQSKRGLTVGYLPQEIDVGRDSRVLEEVLSSRTEFHSLYMELERFDSDEKLGLHSPLPQAERDALASRRVMLFARYQELGGDTVVARAREILSGLGFTQGDFLRPVSQLSGGWHMRVILARLLLGDPELMLLDEPTNHLDLPSMEWFEQYLKSYGGSYIIVSHDREFLNRTVARIAEVDGGKVRNYSGNYDFFRDKKEEQLEHRAKAFRQQLVRIREIEDFIARNRVRKDRAKQVQSRLKMLDKIDRLEAPMGARQLGFSFAQPPRSGAAVLKLAAVAKSYGDVPVFHGLDVTLSRGDKVAIIGENGRGKSTILKIAAGSLSVDSGERLLGHNVSVGYFAQHQLEALNADRTVLQEMMAVVRDESMSQVRSFLGAFLFSGEDVEKKVGILSGGEKSRLALARLMLRPANFLIMDEPTNHLDIASREVLEEALRQFSGTLLLASHDRRFIDALTTRVMAIEPEGVVEYPGNYTYYSWKRAEALASRVPVDGGRVGSLEHPSPRNDKKERKRLEAKIRTEIYREVKPLQEEVARLEKAIGGCEERIAGLETELADPVIYSVFPEKAREKSRELREVRDGLSAHLDDWEKAMTRADEAEAVVRARYDQV